MVWYANMLTKSHCRPTKSHWAVLSSFVIFLASTLIQVVNRTTIHAFLVISVLWKAEDMRWRLTLYFAMFLGAAVIGKKKYEHFVIDVLTQLFQRHKTFKYWLFLNNLIMLIFWPIMLSLQR